MLKNKKTVFAIILAIVAVLLIGIFMIFLCSKPSINKAFISDTYKFLQITSTMKYISSNSKDNAATGGKPEEVEKSLSVLQKDNDIIYETSDSGKYYFYFRKGIEYVAFLDTKYGTNPKGKWTEGLASNFSVKKSFNIAALSNIKPADLRKAGEYYVPIENAKEKIFIALLNLDSIVDHENPAIKISFVDGKIKEIIANFLYKKDYSVTQIYKFEYKQIKLNLPKIAVTQ